MVDSAGLVVLEHRSEMSTLLSLIVPILSLFSASVDGKSDMKALEAPDESSGSSYGLITIVVAFICLVWYFVVVALALLGTIVV